MGTQPFLVNQSLTWEPVGLQPVHRKAANLLLQGGHPRGFQVHTPSDRTNKPWGSTQPAATAQPRLPPPPPGSHPAAIKRSTCARKGIKVGIIVKVVHEPSRPRASATVYGRLKHTGAVRSIMEALTQLVLIAKRLSASLIGTSFLPAHKLPA